MSDPTINVGDLINLLLSGRVDVLECQRVFERDARWVAKLIRSTVRPCPMSSLLFWVPEDQNRPRGGRYQQHTAADLFIIDGHQRSTAFVAAIGQRPPWTPDDEWRASGGPALAVSVGIDRHGEPCFRPTSSDVRGDVPLGALLAGDSIPDLLEHAGLEPDVHMVQTLTNLAAKIKNFEIRVEWVYGTEEHAEECFLLRNEKSTQTALNSEQFRISILTCRFRPLQRDYINPLLRAASDRNMGKVVTLRAVNRVVQHLLPPELRGAHGMRAETTFVKNIAQQVTTGMTSALDYLERIGIVHEDLLPFPSLIDVVTSLVIRYPQALADGFIATWLSHVMAGEVFGGARTVRHELKVLAEGTSYEQVTIALSQFVPSGRPSPFTAERVKALANGQFGSVGCLYALASAAKTAGLVADMHDAAITVPNPLLTLRPLVIDPVKGYLPHYGLMTERTANTIQRHRGWTRSAYEALLPSTQLLEAHQLPEPPAATDERDARDLLDEHRRHWIAATINAYLRTVEPLPGRDEPEQGTLFEAGEWS